MSDIKQPLLLGAHMSIAGGLELAYERGAEIGCTAIQIFTKSNRQWSATPISQDAIKRFIQAQQQSSIQVAIAHASYLINLGATDPIIHQKSAHALAQELDRCHSLSIPYLVLHPGSHGTTDQTACLNKISDTLNTVLE